MSLVKLRDGSLDSPWPRLSADDAVPAEGAVLVPLSRWLSDREALLKRADAVGVWLAPGQGPEDFGPEGIAGLSVIALHFPVFSDGRHYSVARILREQLGYRGELRATGDVLTDQIRFLVRCGFDALETKHQLSLERIRALSSPARPAYQSAADGSVPGWAARAGR